MALPQIHHATGVSSKAAAAEPTRITAITINARLRKVYLRALTAAAVLVSNRRRRDVPDATVGGASWSSSSSSKPQVSSTYSYSYSYSTGSASGSAWPATPSAASASASSADSPTAAPAPTGSASESSSTTSTSK
ncbi:Uncharacterised protein [Mycobacterium tuberculosis]|uniref:Uncharacterized protein n=1 Tax=Mycobacterium tuberculosis TaxID=1773 RepID=A0A655A2Q9_MYCTX|nr:Uncharacterised protein [Mycobacterium tuberculosis]CKS72213.1 Uncharacterised protein [Mycobacterium tuberculosis]CKT44846.1 Uncharacterised protein [Mycobacterium tuberculosis]